PERVTALYHWSTRGSGSFSSTSYPDYEHYRDHARSFASLAAYCRIPSYTPGRDAAENISGEVVTANYFDTMRIRPMAGRFFGPEDERAQVVVIGSKFASRRYGGAGAAIGRTLRLGARDFHIIGVAAEGFSGVVMDWGPAPEFWTPIANIRLIAPVFTFDPLALRGMHWLLAAGRLRDGVSLEQARAELRVLDGQLDRLRDEKHFDAVLMPVSQARFWPSYRNNIALYLATLAAVVVLVLIIACANTATLLLMRAAARRREIGVRMALGAGRGRLARQFLTEALLLSVISGAFGVLLAQWIGDAILTAYPNMFSIPLAVQAAFDWRVAAFGAGLTIAVGILVGLAPLRQALKESIVGPLRGSAAGGRLRTSDAFVLVQMALSVVLLAGAALFVRTLHSAQRVDLTPTPDRVLLAGFDAGGANYTPDQARALHQRVLAEVREVPGVEAASLAMVVPLGGRRGGTDVSAGDSAPLQVDFNAISPGHLQVIGVPLIAGRDFTDRDAQPGTVKVLVNEVFARRFWPDEDVIGKTFRIRKTELAEVIGVVRDGRMKSYRDDPRPCFYRHAYGTTGELTLYVRAHGRPLDLVPEIRRRIGMLDRNVTLRDPRTVRMHLDTAFSQERMASVLVSGLGFLALALASVGLYAVIGAAVARRTREFGVRIAVGASGRDIVSMVLRKALLLAGSGLAIGIGLALVLARAIRSQLFGVAPSDFASFAFASALLAAVAIVAAWLPARRAAKVDPISALRAE
ncbi:MAG TPA: ABC transporter permease, partial [Bryobacteraceae bacterium]|nr:ABC transporter permease [Bryobacteraceae bacterium]